MTGGAPKMAIMESTHTHHRLIDFAKTALFKIFLFPYATVCELFCGQVPDVEKFDEALIGHYIGVDVETSGVSQVKMAWESQRKAYTSDFFELDPCTENLEPHLLDKCATVDIVCCLQHLQICFKSEERARILLRNVSSLLKPGGYFFGITPDSSMIWAKYQKNVEAYHNKGGVTKSNANCIRSESYMITFEIEEEKFPLFGKKYQLKFASDVSGETHCLVHFPSFIRLAREAGLEYVEIQNLTEFYDDNRAQLASLILKFGSNLIDSRGRLLPRSYDVLGLYTTFIFQKPDPDMAPPITTPILPDGPHIYDERDWQGTTWRDDDMNGTTDPPPSLGKISEQKGILGPGPPELRFTESF
ncbi:mRNA cap guanine-N7 methyltransferase 2 isoform X1 [Amaranthus tricolor]|uniref:mRNA cap guanine-N7 methyltransferase 2 isoform X1 n=1 Tax=Amaranthus tricolor TaxID=29722 RepID=UPI00258498A2|nr:mRNA cap guanine-N7 methyltransferase 2 isoform X1 [Amaranthus tricolor]